MISGLCVSRCPGFLIASAAVCFLFLAGCITISAKDLGNFREHYLLVHEDGYGLNSELNSLTTKGLETHLRDTVLKGIEAHVAGSGCREPLQIMIFVHGGLNSYADSFDRMKAMLPTDDKMDGLNRTCYYTIFVNWNSHLMDSIADDLFRLRFGKPNPIVSSFSWPFVVAGRLVGSAADVPVSLMHNGDTIVEAGIGAYEQGDPLHCIFGDGMVHLPLQVLYTVTIPLLESFGTPAWEIMKRRAQLAVASRLTIQTDVVLSYARGQEREIHEGAARTLVRRLNANLERTDKGWSWKQKGNSVPVEVTLVGHSMGAMVLGRLLSVLEEFDLPIRRIIYMAPAAPIDEVEQFVIPYVKGHGQTEFSVFVLNRRDETREIAWGGGLFFMPRGSLLAWIDTFLESETTVGQATAGRMKNLNDYYQRGRKYQKDWKRPQRGRVHCVDPSWDPEQGTPPPEKLPLREQFRKIVPTLEPTLAYRYLIYESPRRIGAKHAPGKHGDFTEPHFFLEVLCHVNTGAFKDPQFCDRPPYWLDG